MRMKSRNLGFRILVVFCVLIVGGVGLAAAQSPVPDRLAGEPSGEFAPGEVIIKFGPDISMSMSNDLMGEHNAQFIETVFGSDLQVWRVAEGQELAVIKQLNADPGVAYAEPNYSYSIFDTVPNDPDYPKQWAHPKMQSPKGWDLSTGSTAVTIAIIDTGIDEAHPDLAGKIVGGWDFVDSDSNPHDTNGHGTHVAGISAANANNGTGIAGVSWGARVMPIRVLGTTGNGYTTDIVAGVNWARQNGADVINLSLGGINYNQSMQDAVTAAHNAGIVVVAAMGNCRTGCTIGTTHYVNPTQYPAAYDNVFAVAATGPVDEIAAYSQFGTHCDISAPGGNMDYLHDSKGIYSAMPTYSVYLNTASGYYQTYDYLNGTSQATPQVAGLAALILSVDSSMTPSQVEALIENTAVDLGLSGWDDDYGHGRIDIYEALKVISAPAAPVLSAISNGDGDGNFTVDWNDVSNATGYTLQEADNASFSGAQNIYTGAASQTSVSGKLSGTWYYRVLASNAAGNGAWSNSVSTTVKPAAPTLNGIVNPGNADAYTVNWSASVAADGYLLQEDDNGAFSSPTTRYMGSTTQYAVTGQAGGDWYYRVLAYNDGGDSPWSNTQSTTVTVSPLAAPNLLTISNADRDGNYTVDWDEVTGAMTYTLEVSSNLYFTDPAEVYTGTLSQFDVTDQAGGTWHYRVRAANATDNSPWSNSQSTQVNSEIFLPLVVKNYSPSSGIWVNITTLDFEGAFPGSWILLDDSASDGGEYLWGKRNCQVSAGSYSGWAIGGGAQGSALACGSNYPNYIRSWMTYGPFSLTGAQEAELSFKRWLNSESYVNTDFGDWLCAMYSTDGTDFNGTCGSGNTGGWEDRAFDLANVIGESQVWVAFFFKSDFEITYAEGAYIDDVVLRKCDNNCTTFSNELATNPNSNVIEVNIEQQLDR